MTEKVRSEWSIVREESAETKIGAVTDVETIRRRSVMVEVVLYKDKFGFLWLMHVRSKQEWFMARIR